MTDLATRLRAALRPGSAGHPLAPAEPGYDAARKLWNATVDKRPALIARCQNPSDVASAVAAARACGTPLSVRGGGHQVAGLALCDGGLTIDLAPLRSVLVDPAERIAWAGG